MSKLNPTGINSPTISEASKWTTIVIGAFFILLSIVLLLCVCLKPIKDIPYVP